MTLMLARVQQLAQALQAEAGVVIRNGSLTLHFQDGAVQTLDVQTRTRVRGASPVLTNPPASVDKPAGKPQTRD